MSSCGASFATVACGRAGDIDPIRTWSSWHACAAAGVDLKDHQRDAWRGNRRLLPTEPGAMQVGDLVVFLHLPRYGAWSIARVTGGYRYEISEMPNAVDGTPDYGHIRDVELLTGDVPIDPKRDAVSDGLRAAMRNRQRMWSIDPWGEEVERLAVVRPGRAVEVSTMTLKFGYERRDWDAAKAEVVAILGERVRSGRGPMTYGELASKVKAISLEPHQYATFAILGEVPTTRTRWVAGCCGLRRHRRDGHPRRRLLRIRREAGPPRRRPARLLGRGDPAGSTWRGRDTGDRVSAPATGLDPR